MIAGVYQFGLMLFQTALPYLVGELVHYIATGEGGIQSGIGLAFGLAAVSLTSSYCYTQNTFDLRRIGTAIRSGIMMAVYSHALKLTAAARMENTIGQTTNLIAIDAEKLFLAVQYLHSLWHGPLANLIVMALLIREVGGGPAMLGMAVNCFFIPFQNWVGRQIGITRRDMVKHTDERVKVTNEILQYIRVIKLYAWERPMEERISNIRAKELDYLGGYLNYSSLLREALFAVGPFTALVIFVSRVYAFDRPLTLVQIFRVIAFINILRLPTNLLGQALKSSNDAVVSIARLNRFFLLPTLPEHKNKTFGGDIRLVDGSEGKGDGWSENKARINVSNATFSWETARQEGGPRNKLKSKAYEDSSDMLKKLMRSASKSMRSSLQKSKADPSEDMANMQSDRSEQSPAVSNNDYSDREAVYLVSGAEAKHVIHGGEESNDHSNTMEESSNFSLKNLNIKSSRPDELIGIVGQVGCGKPH
jgi:ABC-type multidrug transport system fused ATPase/permease subunit